MTERQAGAGEADQPESDSVSVFGGMLAATFMTVIVMLIIGESNSGGPEPPSKIPTRVLAERVIDKPVTAITEVTTYERPERRQVLRFLWKAPEPAGTLEPGHEVVVTRIGETPRMWKNTVWMEARPAGQTVPVWIRITEAPRDATAAFDKRWRRACPQDTEPNTTRVPDPSRRR